MIGVDVVRLLPSRNHLFEFKDRNKRSMSRISNTNTDTYEEDTRRKAPRWAFLGGGSILPGLDEDRPIITVVAPSVAGIHDGTYKMLGK
jgi:hypothetical protein